MRIIDQIDARKFNGLGRVVEKLGITQVLYATIAHEVNFPAVNARVHPMFDECWIVVVEDDDIYEEHDV